MKRLLIFIIALIFIAYAYGQTPVVKARIEHKGDSILIGDQFDLVVEVSKDLMQVIDFPQFKDGNLSEALEIVAQSGVDTLNVKGRDITLTKKYTLTTFDDGRYNLGKFPVMYLDKNIHDTLWSADSVTFAVTTFAIDTTTQKIHDIKPPLKASLKFGEVSGYIIWVVLAAALIALGVWYYIRRRKNLPFLGKQREKLPPHVVAITALEATHNKKLWQSGKHKLYYTQITDIVRQYISDRYHLGAMEMTTEEIVKALKERDIIVRDMESLRDLLATSDLVKFAKYTPEATTNEEVYHQAYHFVENTKEVIVPQEGDDDEK